ncbi:endolytic transglycosylase MltG [Roseomonas sp. CCTCC AB2023176]|uniref:endolytic transglycosylase MltG n=1 Tax=Roseomonas sp. CCTCC AB2023176 TaxID=3342640 RepID=UPI0035E2E143
MFRFLRFLLVLVLLLGGAVAAAGAFAWSRLTAAGPLTEQKTVVVPRGANTEGISEALLRAGVIDSGPSFTIAAWATRPEGPLRAGEYVFPARGSLRDILEILRTARPVQRRLTIPEGLLARQIVTLLDRTEGLTGETPAIEEGAVLPETYAYQWGDTRAAVVRKATADMGETLREAWAARAQGLPLQSAREALVLASIVERETGQASERAKVASVFINRLRRGMPLQSDPTVTYAATDGATLDRPPTRAELDRDHPFNTYRVRGLPPGPIASPGKDAIRAVTRPENTDFLFFVADGTGGHAFARTLEEHNRNVARWREGREAARAATPAAASTPATPAPAR